MILKFVRKPAVENVQRPVNLRPIIDRALGKKPNAAPEVEKFVQALREHADAAE